MAVPSTGITHRKRSREADVDYPPKKLRRPNFNAGGSTNTETEELPSQKSSKHTKKERKQNRSSRIHSLRKILARGSLPRDIQQEKERELAALLHDQERAKVKKESKRVLERYHYVRFVERQKAEKRLKRLRKQLAAADVEDKEELSGRIHDMEVNRNYAIYAPLDQKYVSVFAEDHGEGNPLKANTASKPAMWYAVEKAMQRGQSDLEALRDGKTKAKVLVDEDDPAVEKHRRSSGRTSKNDQKSIIQVQANKRTKLQSEHQSSKTEVSEDDEMSDGGFFEK